MVTFLKFTIVMIFLISKFSKSVNIKKGKHWQVNMDDNWEEMRNG